MSFVFELCTFFISLNFASFSLTPYRYVEFVDKLFTSNKLYECCVLHLRHYGIAPQYLIKNVVIYLIKKSKNTRAPFSQTPFSFGSLSGARFSESIL